MRVLITGGTGFVGKHLLDVIAAGATSLSMNDVVIASRSPHATEYNVETVAWDVTSGRLPEIRVDAVIHAATPASAELNALSPRLMFDQIVEGARHVIDFCASQPSPPRVVFTSSGAVYGDMPPGVTAWTEDSKLANDPLDAKNAYASGKRAAETLFAIAGSEGICRPAIARLFAFSGRHLPLNRHFALGNFVRDALLGGPILVRGSGSAVRSYLDGDDMATWILAALEMRGNFRKALHIGSSNPIKIVELAELISRVYLAFSGEQVSVRIENRTTALDGSDHYVPDTADTQRLLGVSQQIELDLSIEQMLIANQNSLRS